MSESSYADLFVDPADDPRDEELHQGDELTTLVTFLRWQRQTFELKCDGLDAEQLSRRSVPPSTMSLLGLIRHLADVERVWFRKTMAGEDAPRIYKTPEDRDADFNGAVADPAVVEKAWQDWRSEVAYAESYVMSAPDLDVVGHRNGDPISLRELLVHMVEEYARHNGHADLLRELIDGRTGQ